MGCNKLILKLKLRYQKRTKGKNYSEFVYDITTNNKDIVDFNSTLRVKNGRKPPKKATLIIDY